MLYAGAIFTLSSRHALLLTTPFRYDICHREVIFIDAYAPSPPYDVTIISMPPVITPLRRYATLIHEFYYYFMLDVY